MINWFAVAIIPIAAMIGAELGRRRLEAKGDIYSFQPQWVTHVSSGAVGTAIVLFVEAAKAALADPSSFHLWTLILSAGAGQVFLMFFAVNELRCAKKWLAEPTYPFKPGTN
jgi:hypothetical protein